MNSLDLLKHFPEKDTPREPQKLILKELGEALENNTKFIIIQGPTGSGKSHIAATLANLSKDPDVMFKQLVDNYEIFEKDAVGNYTHARFVETMDKFGCAVLTVTKALQNQYDSLFNNSEILKGKQNYICDVDEDFDCDLAPCLLTSKILDDCKVNNRCPYLNARREALKARFAVFNYSAFFSLPDFIKPRQFIVCDEASELEDELVKHYSCEIIYDEIEDLDIKKLQSDDQGAVLRWVTDLSLKLGRAVEALMQQFNKYKNNKRGMMSMLIKIRTYKILHESLILILQNWYKAEYITEFTTKNVIMRPLYVNTIAQDFFKYADTVILMSGTIIDHKTFAATLGITDYKYIEADSEFDAAKSPVYCSLKDKVNHKTIDTVLPKIIENAIKICEHYPKDKGIIHTHTFKITEAFQKKVKENKRFLFREPGITNEFILAEHFMRKDATVLISPSLGFGTDLPDESGRFSIIAKTPYLPLGDARIKKLADRSQRWYTMKALVNLVQMCGRTTRNKDDFSDTFILDGTAVDLMKRNWQYMPKWFRDRIK